MNPVDRRKFLKIAAVALGAGALYQCRRARRGEGGRLMELLGKSQRRTPDSLLLRAVFRHARRLRAVRPDPLGTQAFERAVEMVNALPQTPELVLFTGDLTHDSEKPGRARGPDEAVSGDRGGPRGADGPMRSRRARRRPSTAATLFRENFGDTFYSFDHRGVHFIALDNVSRGKPAVGPDQLAWLRDRPRAVSEVRADHRLHASPALRPEARTGNGSRATATR